MQAAEMVEIWAHPSEAVRRMQALSQKLQPAVDGVPQCVVS